MSENSTIAWSKKLYLYQVLFYGTIGAIILLPTYVQLYCSLPLATFLSFFVVVTLRAVFESRFLYGTSFAKIALKQIALLSLTTAGLMTLFFVIIKPKLGWYAIPLSIIFASMIVEKVKAKLFPNGAPPSGARAQFALKIRHNTIITYGFYSIFVPITILLYSYYQLGFFYAVALGYLLGAFFEELCVARMLYAKRLTIRLIMLYLLWSMICAGLAASTIWAIMNFFGLAGQTATIMGIIAVKLIQPLGYTQIWD